MKKYCNGKKKLLKKLYLFAIILWLLIIFVLKLYKNISVIEFIILAIPIVIFITAYFSIEKMSSKVEKSMFKTNILTLGLLVTVPLIGWISNINEDKQLFLILTSCAIILSMMSLVDIWVSDYYMCVVNHGKSILQTLSIVLLTFALVKFFITFKADSIK